MPGNRALCPTAAKTQPLSWAQLPDTWTSIPATLCFHVSKQPETICWPGKEKSKQFSCSGCKLSWRLKYSWRARLCVLCKGEELNSEQVLLQEQLNLGLGLYFMEKLLKSKNKSNTLKQQGNGKLQGTGVSIFWTKPFTDSDFFFFFINMLLKQHRICFNECFALALRVCTFTYFIEYSELPSQHLWVSMLPAWVSPTDFLLLLLKMRWFPIAPPASNSLINKNQGDSQAEALQAWCLSMVKLPMEGTFYNSLTFCHAFLDVTYRAEQKFLSSNVDHSWNWALNLTPFTSPQTRCAKLRAREGWDRAKTTGSISSTELFTAGCKGSRVSPRLGRE